MDVVSGNCTLSDDRNSTVLPVLGVEERVVEEQNNEDENVEAIAAHFCRKSKSSL